jgi:hypothetical protein
MISESVERASVRCFGSIRIGTKTVPRLRPVEAK